ncbi:hypothetical protein ACWGS5_13530 [Streptomyces albidoflavus]
MRKPGTTCLLLALALGPAACAQGSAPAPPAETGHDGGAAPAPADPGRAAWDALSPEARETVCDLVDGRGAEAAAATLEFYGEHGRPGTYDTSEEAHAERVALMRYATQCCPSGRGQLER